jgi:hypothetical protein
MPPRVPVSRIGFGRATIASPEDYQKAAKPRKRQDKDRLSDPVIDDLFSAIVTRAAGACRRCLTDNDLRTGRTRKEKAPPVGRPVSTKNLRFSRQKQRFSLPRDIFNFARIGPILPGVDQHFGQPIGQRGAIPGHFSDHSYSGQSSRSIGPQMLPFGELSTPTVSRLT